MDNKQIPESCLSVVMPVYNEEQTLRQAFEKVISRPEVGEVILVDDASSDGTWEVLQQLKQEHENKVKAFRHEINRGKGAALRTGFANTSCNYVIVQDADLEYDPEEYPRLLYQALHGGADAVYGSRFLHPGNHRVQAYWHTFGNALLTWLSNVCTNLKLSDMETCYKLFRADMLKRLELQENRFGIEPEITAKLAKQRANIYEVAISYHGRTYDQGKKIGWKDGFSAIRCIIKYNLFQ